MLIIEDNYRFAHLLMCRSTATNSHVDGIGLTIYRYGYKPCTLKLVRIRIFNPTTVSKETEELHAEESAVTFMVDDPVSRIAAKIASEIGSKFVSYPLRSECCHGGPLRALTIAPLLPVTTVTSLPGS